MKNLFQYITVLIVLLHTFSCNNDFLTEESNINIINEISPIVISPDWEANDYSIYCQGIGNAKFTIADVPAWLKISSASEQFTNGYATLNCKANVFGVFSEIGMYHTYMILSVEGRGNVAVPVVYIVEGNPVIATENSLTISYDLTLSTSPFLIENTGNGILFWSVVDHPDWLKINNQSIYKNEVARFLPPNNTVTLYFSYNSDIPYSENLSGKIVIESNDKNKPFVEIEIQVDLGNPNLQTHGEFGTINFERTGTTAEFWFSNQGVGYLSWKVEGCPEWLTVSDYSKISDPYSSHTLTFTCNRELMSPGVNAVTIYLKTNDKNNPSYPINVTAVNYFANPDDIKSIPGDIMDVRIDKQSDILYLTTKQPNRLLAYDIKSRTLVSELPLGNIPNCFSISEDGLKAVVGHSGYITSVDLDNFSIIKTIEIDHDVHDIEWGKDNWCCYSAAYFEWTSLNWINVNTNEKNNFDQVYEKCRLRKIPGQSYILGVETAISSGIYIFDIDTRKKKYNGFAQIPIFWFSENGNYVYTGGGTHSLGGLIFRTSTFFANNYITVSPVGIFTPDPYNVFWINHHAASQSVWILSSSSDYYFDLKRKIVQFTDSDYIQKATYNYDDYHNDRHVIAHYVFARQDGTELVVIKNATSGDFMWSLEFIQVTN